MKSCKTLGSHFILAIMALTLLAVQIATAAETPPAADAVAVVNGTPISRQRFDQEVDRASQRFARQGQPMPEAMVKMMQDRVLEFLIGEELLFQESVKKGIKITDEKVAEEIAKVKSQFGSDEKFKEALANMNVTEEKVESDIRRGLTIQQLVEKEVVDTVKVSDEEIKTFYDENQKLFTKQEQVQASHILIKVNKDADEAQKAEARAKIDAAAKRVKDGEDFAVVATEVSEGPSNTKGGDLGFFQRGQMVKPFEEVAFTLQPGEVSDVVETDFGYHIIKVFDKQEPTTATFDEVKTQIADHLKQEKAKTAVQAYIDKLKESANIEKNV